MRFLAIPMFAFAMLAVSFGYADPQSSRVESISTGAGTDAEYHFDQYRSVLSEIGRAVTDVQITARNGLGSIKGLAFKHELTTGKQCQGGWDVEQVNVAFIGDLYAEIRRAIKYMNIGNKTPVDMQIISTFGTGRPAGVAIYYCK